MGRLRGNVSAYMTHELRWQFKQVSLMKRPVGFSIVPLFEMGYVSSSALTRHDPMLLSLGLGGRAIYDEAFVFRLDFAFALERQKSSATSPTEHVLRPGVYAIVGHTF